MDTDIRVREIKNHYMEFTARSPLKFGAVVVPYCLYCQTKAVVEDKKGRIADGWGGMFLMDFWGFPSPRIEHPVREKAMVNVNEKFARALEAYGAFGHPVEIFNELEGELDRIRIDVSKEMSLPDEMPFLGALVCASPLDAAIHDAYGKMHGLSTYGCYGKDFMNYDLSRYLGDKYQGRYISDFIRKEYARELPVFHLVGGLDKLRKGEVDENDPKDGLPNSLDEWVERDGLVCLKIKLKGSDLDWDLHRTLEVVSIAHEVQDKQGRDELFFSADTNEQCESPDYMIEYLNELKGKDERAFRELLYVEQPTERDLRASMHDMHKLAAVKPVIIDESLTSLEDMELALKLGWSGIALKACKTQSQSLILASKAEAEGIPYTIQDLSNPALALIHSAGLAARLNPMMGVEANSCQYFGASSVPEAKVHPGVFHRTGGKITTESIKGPGLGFQIEEIQRRL